MEIYRGFKLWAHEHEHWLAENRNLASGSIYFEAMDHDELIFKIDRYYKEEAGE